MLPVAGTVESIVHSLLFGGGGGAQIKAVQHGAASIPNNGTTVDVTISPVNMARSFVVFSHSVSLSGGSPKDALVIGRLIASDRLRFERYGFANECLIRWSVVEFAAGVSVQYVEGTLTNSNTDFTISPVNVNRAFVLIRNTNKSSGSITYDSVPRAYLYNSTTVRVEVPFYSNIGVVSIYVVEVTG